MNMYQFLRQAVRMSQNALFLVRENITFKEALPLIHTRTTILYMNDLLMIDMQKAKNYIIRQKQIDGIYPYEYKKLFVI